MHHAYLIKQALSPVIMKYLNSVDTPVRGGLAGLGAGALLGGLKGLISPEEGKGRLSSAFSGAATYGLGGAALGAGAGKLTEIGKGLPAGAGAAAPASRASFLQKQPVVTEQRMPMA